MVGLITGAKVAQFLAPLVLPAVVAGVAFGAGIAFEHRPVQGFPFNLIGQGLAVQRDAALTRVGAAERDRDAARAEVRTVRAGYLPWVVDLNACRTGRITDRAAASNSLTGAAQFASTQARAAYDLGRASCPRPSGARPNAPAPDYPRGPADPIDDRLRDAAADDLRGLFTVGAYAPGRAPDLSGRGGDAPAGRTPTP